MFVACELRRIKLCLQCNINVHLLHGPHFLCRAPRFWKVGALLAPTHFRLNSNPDTHTYVLFRTTVYIIYYVIWRHLLTLVILILIENYTWQSCMDHSVGTSVFTLKQTKIMCCFGICIISYLYKKRKLRSKTRLQTLAWLPFVHIYTGRLVSWTHTWINIAVFYSLNFHLPVSFRRH